MEIKVRIDASKFYGKLWEEYDGNLSMRQWMRKENKNHLNIFKEKILSKIGITHVDEMKIERKEKEIHLTFTWQEKENINQWVNEVKQDKQAIEQYIWTHTPMTTY